MARVEVYTFVYVLRNVPYGKITIRECVRCVRKTAILLACRGHKEKQLLVRESWFNLITSGRDPIGPNREI